MQTIEVDCFKTKIKDKIKTGMIKYKLCCKNCEFVFDSWFASSHEYEKLKKKKLLNCHFCNSEKVEKTLMAPKLLKQIKTRDLELKKMSNKIKEYQKFIKNNFDYVGENFAYEARTIHYNNKKKHKGIYGTASNEEIKELREEGIVTNILPWREDKNN